MTEHHNAKSPSLPLLFGVYILLMVLLVLTLIAARLPLGPIALVVALAIAAAKSTLVVLFFMHVRYSSRVTWVFVGAGLLWLSILFSLTFAEYVGRERLTRAEPLHQRHVP
jgi:cytochrome c oxidase subunit 4